jgi:serine/threonine protein kinase
MVGRQLGPYKVLDILSEGGMGVVYLAEQECPFRRRVALKVIKIGMNTREVVARFEGERQALAMMSHSHIAQIYGAGVTDDGRPYFVMEHVPGIPITEYCDQSELPTRTRLELFVLVCGAIEHAHQKGIIHRDIKPHNVLVTVEDSRPVPKVIDFGVAKATRQRLTEKTVFTHLGLLIGTPEYMSPEQAELGTWRSQMRLTSIRWVSCFMSCWSVRCRSTQPYSGGSATLRSRESSERKSRSHRALASRTLERRPKMSPNAAEPTRRRWRDS